MRMKRANDGKVNNRFVFFLKFKMMHTIAYESEQI